jgi:hypothetical protein
MSKNVNPQFNPSDKKRFKAGRIYGYQLLNGALIAGCDW